MTTTQTQPRKRVRRTTRRRVHRGRVAVLAIVLISLIVLVVFCVRKCSGSDAVEVINETVIEAMDCGRNDAKQVLETAAGTMERQNALLHIKAREYELRSSGFANAADDYKKGAETVLKGHSIL